MRCEAENFLLTELEIIDEYCFESLKFVVIFYLTIKSNYRMIREGWNGSQGNHVIFA